MMVNVLTVGEDGESRWSDLPITLTPKVFAPPAQDIELSEPVAAQQMLCLRLRAGWDEPAHPTPIDQTLICLTGQVAVTASDGEVRMIGPWDLWRMADTFGKGHHTKVSSDEDFTCVIVQHG